MSPAPRAQVCSHAAPTPVVSARVYTSLSSTHSFVPSVSAHTQRCSSVCYPYRSSALARAAVHLKFHTFNYNILKTVKLGSLNLKYDILIIDLNNILVLQTNAKCIFEVIDCNDLSRVHVP